MPQHFVSKFVDVTFGGVINFICPPFEVHASGVSCKHFIFLFLHSAGFEKQTYCSQHLYLRILLVVFLSIVSLDSCCLHVILLSSTHLLLAMYSLHRSPIGATDVVVTGVSSHLYRGQHRSFNVGANLSFSNVARLW